MKMKKILAVSGGIDSMLLLWQYRDDPEAIVAHFNHGTRPSADDDADFVRKMAKKYGKDFFYKKVTLGEDISEVNARMVRYEFLREVADTVARKNGLSENMVKIYTAHHLNDLAESIAINLLRGTGWRGLTPFSDTRIKRPFIDQMLTKKDVTKLAVKHRIIFRQDPTNTEAKYLRNRLRVILTETKETNLMTFYNLYQKQQKDRSEIEQITGQIVGQLVDGKKFRKDFFLLVDDQSAQEILYTILAKHQISLTRPQLMDLVTAIRTYLPGKKFNLPKDRFITIYKHYCEL